MELYSITAIRLIHIFAGVFWAGAALVLAGFIEPAVRAAGPEGGKFMQHLMQKTILPLIMTVASLIATLTGAVLYWKFSGGLEPAWVLSHAGLSFTIGSLAGLLAVLLGSFVTGPTAKRLAALGKQMQTTEGPNVSVLVSEMGVLHKRLSLSSQLSAVLLTVTVIGMATARYI